MSNHSNYLKADKNLIFWEDNEVAGQTQPYRQKIKLYLKELIRVNSQTFLRLRITQISLLTILKCRRQLSIAIKVHIKEIQVKRILVMLSFLQSTTLTIQEIRTSQDNPPSSEAKRQVFTITETRHSKTPKCIRADYDYKLHFD